MTSTKEMARPESAPRSGSTQVLEYLRSLPAETEFSSQSIQKALGDKISSSGVVTGFLAKLKADGKITVTSQGRSPSGAPINLYSAESAGRRGLGREKPPASPR